MERLEFLFLGFTVLAVEVVAIRSKVEGKSWLRAAFELILSGIGAFVVFELVDLIFGY